MEVTALKHKKTVEFKNSIRSICRIKDIKKEANPTL
jgi:hypothetical protein